MELQARLGSFGVLSLQRGDYGRQCSDSQEVLGEGEAIQRAHCILMGTRHHLRMASLVDLANFVTKVNYGDELEKFLIRLQ